MSCRVASSLETVHINNVRPGVLALKAFSTIARGSPGLESLTICNHREGVAIVLNKIGAFSQIRKLVYENLDFQHEGREVNYGVLARLCSLKVETLPNPI